MSPQQGNAYEAALHAVRAEAGPSVEVPLANEAMVADTHDVYHNPPTEDIERVAVAATDVAAIPELPTLEEARRINEGITTMLEGLRAA